MLKKEIDKAHEAAIMGEEVRVWLASPIGQYILRQRVEVEKKVLEAFRRLDPSDAKGISDLQRALDAAHTGVQCLEDAISVGKQYVDILTMENDSHE